MAGLIQSVDTSDVREGIDPEDAVPCPMCGKRHVLDVVGASGMNEKCFASLMSQRRQMRRQVDWLKRQQETG
jgi:hypothetical protein